MSTQKQQITERMRQLGELAHRAWRQQLGRPTDPPWGNLPEEERKAWAVSALVCFNAGIHAAGALARQALAEKPA